VIVTCAPPEAGLVADEIPVTCGTPANFTNAELLGAIVEFPQSCASGLATVATLSSSEMGRKVGFAIELETETTIVVGETDIGIAFCQLVACEGSPVTTPTTAKGSKPVPVRVTMPPPFSERYPPFT